MIFKIFMAEFENNAERFEIGAVQSWIDNTTETNTDSFDVS
jgi:hypothetical protein